MSFTIGKWTVHLYWTGGWHWGYFTDPKGLWTNLGPVVFDVVSPLR